MTIWQWGKVASVLLALGAASGAGLIAQDGSKPPGDGLKVANPAATPATPGDDPRTVAVRPGKLTYTLNSPGVVEPAQIRDIICEVESSTVINSILPDGSQVKQGEVVAELDSATLRDSLTNQHITTQRAEAAYKEALLAREIAEYAVREYVEGIIPQRLAELEVKVTNTQANLDRAKARLERTKQAQDRVVRAGAHRPGPEAPIDILSGLTIADRLEAAEVNLQSLTNDLETAKTEQKIYQEYTREVETRRLRSDVEKARAGDLSKQSSWELEKIKEAKLERQIKACRLVAPFDGVLVWAGSPGKSGLVGVSVIEEGATVRARQQVCTVIDTATPMRVRVNLFEADVDRVRLGQSVQVKLSVFPGQVLTGIVQSVAPRPDAKAFADAKLKVYPTVIQLDRSVPGLKAQLLATVDIPIFDLDDVLSVPVGAVVHLDGKDRVAVRTAEGGVELRAVTLGRTNGPAVEVKAGLKPGDRVFLDPAGSPTRPARAN